MHCSRILEAGKFQFFANSARLCLSMFERALHTASSAETKIDHRDGYILWPLPLPSPRISSPTRRCYKKAKFERAWRSRPRSRLQCRQVSCAWKPNGRAAPVGRRGALEVSTSDPRRGMSKPRLKINPRQRDRKQHCGTIAAIWLIGCERASLASHPGVDLWKGKRKFSLVGQSSSMSAYPQKRTCAVHSLMSAMGQ